MVVVEVVLECFCVLLLIDMMMFFEEVVGDWMKM